MPLEALGQCKLGLKACLGAHAVNDIHGVKQFCMLNLDASVTAKNGRMGTAV